MSSFSSKTLGKLGFAKSNGHNNSASSSGSTNYSAWGSISRVFSRHIKQQRKTLDMSLYEGEARAEGLISSAFFCGSSATVSRPVEQVARSMRRFFTRLQPKKSSVVAKRLSPALKRFTPFGVISQALQPVGSRLKVVMAVDCLAIDLQLREETEMAADYFRDKCRRLSTSGESAELKRSSCSQSERIRLMQPEWLSMVLIH